MKVIIIEDELLSADLLVRILGKTDPSIEVVAILDSVKASVEAFQNGLKADLIFLDIHLADGISFDLFSQVAIDMPVIFTTAYSEYAIKAFEVNSVGYLLKPISHEDVRRALDKYTKFGQKEKDTLMENISNVYKQLNRQYKSRFMVKQGSTIDSIKTDDIHHFVTHEGITFLVGLQGKRYPVDYTLDQLESMLSPDDFFRINRKVILSIRSIQKVNTYFNSRLVITTSHLEGEAAIVSRERVNDFKGWLDR